MFRIKPTRPHNRIDLQTVRETLSYIRDDVAGDPSLAEVTYALEDALIAIDAAQKSSGPPSSSSELPILNARFFASRPRT